MGQIAASTNAAVRPGMILSGRLRLERVVGQGSMGIVFEATDITKGSCVAVKVMIPERANNIEARRRFLREARAALLLSSEHVTKLLDVGELPDGTPFLVMEYLFGSTLEHIVLTDGPPPIAVAVDWVLQALEGVAEAHREGFVHRDLKPENLFLAERPNQNPIVKVLDFGTVKDLLTKATKLTKTGSTMGSPAYMPPEQIRAEEIDARADVWAMGVTLYELVTGFLPFNGDSLTDTLAAILREQPVPLRARRPDAPRELEAVIGCALAKDPARRYASAAELAAALSAIRARMGTTTDVTRTIRLDNELRETKTDAFADTTDLRSMAHLVEMPSRIRPRVVVKPTDPPAAPKSRARVLVAAIAGALAIGGLAGALLTLHHAPAELHARTATHAPALHRGVAAPSALKLAVAPQPDPATRRARTRRR